MDKKFSHRDNLLFVWSLYIWNRLWQENCLVSVQCEFLIKMLYTLLDASPGTARVEALDANDQAPVFSQSSLFAAVEENAEFGTSVTQLEVRKK